jgi:predicted metal-dependent hydrolase
MVEPKVPPDKRPTHKAIKVGLKTIVRDDIVIQKLGDVVVRANKIVIHTLQFMKLYFIHCYDNDTPLPIVDRALVKCFMKVLCKSPSQGRPPSEATVATKAELEKFYKLHYEHLKDEELTYTHMNTILDYLADTITTIYENNIEQRFVSYIDRFINVSWKKNQLIEIIKKSKRTQVSKHQLINTLTANLRKVKNDLLDTTNTKTSLPIYHSWIDSMKTRILPKKQFQKESVHYDLVCAPQDYLPCMVYMTKSIEETGSFINSVFPLRREVIPKYVPFDTTTICHILMTEKKEYYLTKGNLKAKQGEIWNMFFKTNYRKYFHTHDKYAYQFSHMIETDGIGCSILLVRKDLKGKRLVNQRKNKGREDEYIDELKDYTPLQGKNVVAIDPNLSDLLFCVNGTDRDANKFRYTQDQRRKETKVKKYRDLLLENKKKVVEGKSIIEWETELSHYNSKTLNFERFKAYIGKKNTVNTVISPFYEEQIYRKLKLGSYMLRQKTEAKMLKRFEQLFGKPEDTIIGIGDFEQQQHCKFKEPVKGKGFRTLLRKQGYKVYLVNEFRTSCMCSACEGNCETFRHCKNPRPWKNNTIIRHGLLECKTCLRLWNRDMNASFNIHKIVQEAIAGRPRPEYLKRSSRPLIGTASVS